MSVSVGRRRVTNVIEEKQKENQSTDLRKNRALIEAGQHWGWLKCFGQQYLYKPDKTEEFIDDPQIVEKALLDCFDFLAPHVPSLETLAGLPGSTVAMVLHAACLATFRQKGSLEGIALNVLQAVKTDGVGGSGYQKGEAEKFETELDRLIFSSDEDAVVFAIKYIEPQFARTDDSTTQIYMLDHGSAFARVKGAMALNWLTRYPDMPSNARETLFGDSRRPRRQSKVEYPD